MGELKVRSIDFTFDEVPFYWNRGNPHWGNFVNFVTVIGPAFERYFIKAIRQAMPLIKDPAVKKDADLFCLQEAQHSRQHLAHLRALTDQYPALEAIRKQVLDSYEHLFATESMEFHLSYAATVELTFGPIAKFVIENRDVLFKDCDKRIAAFMLWHLVEEFEHRNSAINIYNDVVGKYGYRMKSAVGVFKHLVEIDRITRECFSHHIPPCQTAEGNAVVANDISHMFKDISVWRQCGFFYNLFCTLLPYHKPDNLQQPEWATQWFADEAAGKDMTLYY